MESELRPLTSLRFFAAMMIVIFHAKETFSWPWLAYAPTFLWSGVSFFFVLSGFILTHVYRSRNITYGRFIWLRIARLWPTHFAMIVFIAAVLPAGSDTFRGVGFFDYRLTAIANTFMVQSAVPYMAYYFSWNSPSWSISTEFFFYLLFPLFLVGIDRTWHWKLALAALLSASMVALSIWLDLQPAMKLFDLTATSFVGAFPLARLGEFCLGMAANVIWRKYVHPLQMTVLTSTIAEIVAVVLCIGWLSHMADISQLMSSFAARAWFGAVGGSITFAPMIVALAAGRGIIGSLLGRRELVYLGAISFPMYMLHHVLIRCFNLGVAQLPKFPSESLFFSALFIGSVVVHEWVERPFRTMLTKPRTLAPQQTQAAS